MKRGYGEDLYWAGDDARRWRAVMIALRQVMVALRQCAVRTTKRGPQCGHPSAPYGAGNHAMRGPIRASRRQQISFQLSKYQIMSHSEPRQRAKNLVYCECRTIWGCVHTCASMEYAINPFKILRKVLALLRSRMTLISGRTWDLCRNVAL